MQLEQLMQEVKQRSARTERAHRVAAWARMADELIEDMGEEAFNMEAHNYGYHLDGDTVAIERRKKGI